MGTKGFSVKFHSLLCPPGVSQQMQPPVSRGSFQSHSGHARASSWTRSHTHSCTHVSSPSHMHMQHMLTYTRLLKLTHLDSPSQMRTPSHTEGSPAYPSHSHMPTHNCSSSRPHTRPYKCIPAYTHTQSGSLSQPHKYPLTLAHTRCPYYVSGGTLHALS